MCKYCNIKQNSSLAWLSAQDVEAICGPPLKMEDFRGCYCVTGLDLSQTTDLTAAVVPVERNGVLYVFAHFWMPAEKLEQRTAEDGVPYQAYIQRGFLSLSGENFVDYHDVKDWVDSLVRDYELYPIRNGYDRYSSQYLIKELDADGYQTSDVYQGDNLWPVLQEMEGLIKDHKVNIGDNDLLKAHLLNAAVKMSAERGRGRLVKINSRARIDGVAAFADAMAVRQHDYAEIGYQLKNEE